MLSKHNLDQSPYKKCHQIWSFCLMPERKRKGIDGKRLNLLGAKAITQCTSFASLVAGLICFCRNHIFMFYLEETSETEKNPWKFSLENCSVWKKLFGLDQSREWRTVADRFSCCGSLIYITDRRFPCFRTGYSVTNVTERHDFCVWRERDLSPGENPSTST